MIKIVFSCCVIASFLFSSNINIDFNNLSTQKFIKIVAKALDKDIYFEEKIEGKVNFISTGAVTEKQIFTILKNDLDLKGFEIIETDQFIKIVKKSSVKNIESKKMEILQIQNVEAKNIYEILLNTFTKEYYNKTQTPTISLDEKNNSIVVIGIESDIEEIIRLAGKLDVEQQQVYVQAKIIEISEMRTKNLGLKYGLNGFNTNTSNILTFSSALNGMQSVKPLSLNELNSYSYGIGDLKDSFSLGVALNILKQNKALDLVSEPSLLCINNKKSSIYVGETRSVVTGTTVGTTTTTNFKREDIGLMLSVVPRISSNNKVTLTINTKIEDIKETDLADDGTPSTNKKEVITTAVVQNGHNVILGGLIKNKVETIEDKVPFFGDIPIFGELFKNQHDINDKINLVIIITPYIVSKSQDLSRLRTQLSKLKVLEEKVARDMIDQLDTNSKNENNTARRLDGNS